MNLLETQRLFHELASRSDGSIDPAAFLTGTPDLDARARIGIYADMFVWRQIDALRDDFPKLTALLGDSAFYAMAEEYLRAHPSRHASLSELGRELPEFLRSFAGDGARADLPDLASLEWARAKVFEDANVAAAWPAALRDLEATELPQLRLTFVPALRVLQVGHGLDELWRALEEGTRPETPARGPQLIAVWRRDFEVYHAPIETDEAAALDLARAGAPLGAVCEAFAHRTDAAQAAFAAVSSWFVEGWICEENQ